MAKERINILMTGGGAPGAAGILRCLQEYPGLHVTVADANPQATGRYLGGEFHTIPLATNISFIDALLSLCKEKNIDVLFPLVTRELLPLSRHVKDFELIGTKVLISPQASLEIANDKGRLYEFLQWRGIAVPEFRIVDAIGQFEIAIGELGYPSRAVCFKPTVSNGSRGFRVISEKTDELDLLFNHKPATTYISSREVIRILSTGPLPELLVSEFLPGDEYSVDCLCKQGEAKLVVPRLRKRMINGISVEGEFVKEENIITYCGSVIKELQLHGNIGIQVKRSAAGQYLILEINPRVQGTISAALGAGVNLPLLAIKQELDLPIADSETHVKWGTKFSRYWSEVFY
jgi:carbamoyl-phosphate synthase large subunit